MIIIIGLICKGMYWNVNDVMSSVLILNSFFNNKIFQPFSRIFVMTIRKFKDNT